jgi:hypothetical protein
MGGIADQCQRAASATMKPIPHEREEQDWHENQLVREWLIPLHPKLRALF